MIPWRLRLRLQVSVQKCKHLGHQVTSLTQNLCATFPNPKKCTHEAITQGFSPQKIRKASMLIASICGKRTVLDTETSPDNTRLCGFCSATHVDSSNRPAPPPAQSCEAKTPSQCPKSRSLRDRKPQHEPRPCLGHEMSVWQGKWLNDYEVT